MNITRNTLRADGLTVGEAMDRDYDFLRSIGVQCKRWQSRDEKLDEFKDTLRAAVLYGCDLAAKECGLKDGWKDYDIPLLSKTLDAHAERVFNRTHPI